MELTLENLDEIHDLLMTSYEESRTVMNCIDFSSSILPLSEKRSQINSLMDKASGYLLEMAHIESFLKECNLYKGPLSPQQKTHIFACQQLCQSLMDSSRKMLQWIVQVKAEFNEASCPVPDDTDQQRIFEHHVDNAIPSPVAMYENYQQLRSILKDIHKDLLFVDPENMINTAGRRLDVMKGKQMFIETEHEMNVLIDYGLFQYRKNGKNIAERYYDSSAALYSGSKLSALYALKNSRFSLLQIIKPVDEHGLLVNDPLIDQSFLMIDNGLHQLAKKNTNYAVLTHYLQLPGFVMTTGASVPIALDTIVGKKMQVIFDRAIRHSHGVSDLDSQSYLQCITDLFKMAIHEDVVKTVFSRELPMG